MEKLTEIYLHQGLSLPNPKKILGSDFDPKKWIVFYLGSKKTAEALLPAELPSHPKIIFLSRKGIPKESPLPFQDVEGMVFLDGNWAQAKTLWWRNPWLLKLHRAILIPREASLYGNLRREPRREAISTLEAVASAIEIIEESPKTSKSLLLAFADHLAKKA